MQSLSLGLYPREAGLTPYRVTFQRVESAGVPSLLTEGLRYQHPACEQTAQVWAASEAGIATVLTYHYQGSWCHLQVLERTPPQQEKA